MLFGVALVHRTQNLVIVEGGAKSIARYTKLMLRRIQWNDPFLTTTDKEEYSESNQQNTCIQVWKGTSAKLHFDLFEIKEVAGEWAAMEYLRPFGLESLWAYSSSMTSVAESKVSMEAILGSDSEPDE